jgi:putative ABC transport system ATP-binding protein
MNSPAGNSSAWQSRERWCPDPQLLICDEPTGDLDRKTADEVLRLLQRLNAEFGKTIIMVTHDPKAADYARRTVHLDKGTLVDNPAAH